MTEQQITDEVLRYLRDEAYNYAILIDGEWGSGKTYYVKNSLSDTIAHQEREGKNRAIKYVSLYGCKNMADVQENVAWTFAENARDKLKEKSETNQSVDKIFGNVLLSSRKIGNAILKKFVPDLSAYDIATDWLNMGSFIFMFDDLERCDCPINEVFGFINELVEHEGTKVILIANEKELTGIAEPEYLEQQYRLALEEKIDWPKEQKGSYWSVSNRNNGKITLNELERRRQLLFPMKDANSEYRKIREKLIGVTLRFTPDVPKIMIEIVRATNYNSEIKSLLLEHVDSFTSTMKYYRHNNLRTFQFYLSKVSYLLERLDDIELQKEYMPHICEHIISETYSQAIKYKSNYRPPRDNSTWLSSEQDTKSVVIKNYIESGEFYQESFRKDILTIQDEFKALITDDDPYYLIYQQYYHHTQQWCEEQLEKMIIQLQKNKYPLSFYAKIIVAVQRLIDLGFDSEYMSRIKQLMLYNIKGLSEATAIDEDLWFCDDQKFKGVVHEIIVELNTAIENHTAEVESDKIKEILGKEDWIERLGIYVNPNHDRYVRDIPVFSKAEPDSWVQVLHNADPEGIDGFRTLLRDLYPRDVIRNSYQQDKESIKEIRKQLEQLEESDLIKKAAIGWLCNQFDQIIKTNENSQYSLVKENKENTEKS